MNGHLLVCVCENLATYPEYNGEVDIPMYLAGGLKLLQSYATCITGDMVLERAELLDLPISSIFELVVIEFKDGVPVSRTPLKTKHVVSIPTVWQ